MAFLPSALERAFRKFEDRTKPYSDHDVAAAIQAYRKTQEDAGHEMPSELLAESMAFDFCEDYHHGETGWGTYYGPMLVVPRDGKLCESPSIQLVTPEILEYWQARSQEASHPILRIRYADLVWDFSRKIRQKRADVICAETVVDSNIELATKRLFAHVPDARDKLGRALSIAQFIRDTDRVNSVTTTIIALESDTAKLDELGTWGFSFDLLIENKKVQLSADEESEIIAQLESYLSHAAVIDGDSGYPIDHAAAQRAAIRLARYYHRKTKRDDIRRVLTLYAAAVKAIAKKAMAMVGVHWLREVYDVLVQYGIKDEADAVAVLMRERGQGIQNEMVRTTHSIEIPKKDVDKYIASMLAGSEDDVVSRICQEFLHDSDEIEEQIRDGASRSVISDMFSRCIIDKEGREVSRIGSVENDLEGRIVQETSQEMRLKAPLLDVVLREWVKRFDVTADRLVERMLRSPLFSADRQDLLKSGFDAYLREDRIAALHVLVPQIEHAFRSLLELLGKSTYRPGRHGGLNLKMLDDLLRDPVTTNAFGKNCVQYFRILLTDQRGWNLRNDVCHGLINIPSSNPVPSDRLIHVLLILSMAVRTNDQHGNSSESDSTEN